MATAKQVRLENFSFASSVKDDVWHPKTTDEAYEWWYFDALSDDGQDALVIIFLDNFIFSPRYNKLVGSRKPRVESQKEVQDSEFGVQHSAFSVQNETPHSAICNPQSSVPALAFIYYHDGKPIYRAINEFAPEHFSADIVSPACNIGDSFFKFESAPYGSGYSLRVKANLPRRRRLEANLEWLSIESDLLTTPENHNHLTDKHNWNLAAPRSDVTGSIKVSDAKNKLLDVRHFRGTGYHDHNWDARWLPAAVSKWQWGRAHFDDYTAVYYRYREFDSTRPITKLFLINDNKITIFDADYSEEKMRRNIFGVKFPREITLTAENGFELNIRQLKSIDESFFYLRFLSEAKLKCPDGKIREAFAITEHLAPKNLKYRWLDWLVNMRIGRNGKGAFL
ncbi:MAG: hypothetical protein ACR2N3_06930 [Pyrinomonadaceae bacterium]